MNLSKTVLVARLCLLITIAFGVAWLLNSCITVAPWQEEEHQKFSLFLACGFLLLASLTAILYGVIKGCKPRIRDSKAKRVFSWILFFALLFAGSDLLTEGHAFYVKAKQRESEQKVILRDNGYYENPYWTWHSLCDIGGVACFGILGLWIYAAFLYKVAELGSRCAYARLHPSPNKVGNSSYLGSFISNVIQRREY